MTEFLAEASVLILPDTKLFREKLLADVAASVAEAQKLAQVSLAGIGVAGGGGAAAAASAAIKEVSKEKAAAVQANKLLEASEVRIATAEKKVLTSSTQAAAARTRFTAATTSVKLTEQAYQKALISTDEELISVAETERTLARERQKAALDTLRAAQANDAAAAAARKAAAAQASAAAGVSGGAAQRVAGTEAVARRVAAAAAAQEVTALRAVASAEEILAAQQKREVTIVGEAAVARSRYAAAVRATAVLQQQANALTAESSPILAGVVELELAYARNLEITTKQQLENVISTNALTAAREREAAATAATAGQVGKALTAQAASVTGLRGAVLTAGGPFLAATVAAVAFGKAVQTAASFQSDLATFGVIAGATAEQMQKVSDTAKQLGRDVTLPGVSAGDAAQALTELSKAGLSVQDSIDGARGVLQLATAASIDNAQATELAASALNAFGLAGNQASHVADVLANAANDAQGSIVDIGIAMQQASAAGRQAGLSLEETVAILTEFARNGIKGSDAGTLLRTMLIRLINPTDKANKIIKDLGLNLRDATGGINLNFFQEFANATRNMTAAERDRDAAIIAGQDAFRGLSILARTGSAALNDQVDSLNKSGTAANVAQARMVGLTGAAKNLQNQLESLGLTIGDLSSGPLTGIVKGLGNFVESLNKASIIIRDFVAPKGFDELNANFQELTNEAAKFQQALVLGDTGFDPIVFATGIQQIAKQLEQTGKELVRQGFLTDVIKNFVSLSPDVKKAMQDNVITPTEQAQLETTALGRAFVGAIPHTADLFQSFGASAKSGIEDAAAQIDRSGPVLSHAMKGTIEDASAAAKASADQGGRDAGATFVKGVTDAITAAEGAVKSAVSGLVRRGRLGAGAAASQLVDIEFRGGGPEQRLTGLKRLLATQKDIVAALVAGDRPRAKIDAAKKDFIATQNQIDSIQSGIDSANQKTINDAKAAAAKRAADAKAAAAKIKADNAAADQAVLDSFAPSEQRISLASTRAAATERLNDDIAVQVLIANTASAQIAIIEKTVKDVKLRNSEIAKRVLIIAGAGVELDRLRKQAAENATASRQAASELVTTNLQKRLQLAQLVGAKDPILDAFDALIANAKKNLSAARKAKKGVLDARIALQQVLKDRKDFLDSLNKDAKESTAKSTTAFDLLKEFNARFNDIAGNLITPDQPFAGGSSFTTDIVNKAIANVRLPTVPQPGVPKGDDVVSRAINANTEALRANTEAVLRGKGNVSTSDGSDGVGPATIGQWGGKAWWSARQFRETRDG